MRVRVKNMLSVLLILIMVLSHVCLFSAAKAETGKCGKNATWTLQNGTLTIGGTGNIYNYESMKYPWTQAAASIKRIVVGEGIRHIGNWAFENCNELKAVRLPSTLTSIGAGSFFFCWQLKKLTLPDGVKRIGDCAFERCKSIKEMVFPDSVKSLGDGVLFYCTSLKRVVLPQGITAIPASMFGRCGELKSIELPETIRSIGAGAFDNCCGLTAITFPENLQVIQGDAFLRTGLRDVTLPASVRRVGAEAFGMSFDLKTLTILNPNCAIEFDRPDDCWHLVPETTILRGYVASTTEEYAKAFGLAFQSIDRTDALQERFGKCGKNAEWRLKDGTLTVSGKGKIYNYEEVSTPWYAVRERIQKVVVGNGITYIGTKAFYYCYNLKKVKLSDTVRRIGASAFAFCYSLRSINLPNGMSRIDDSAFERCEKIKEVVFPDSIQTLESNVLYQCYSLERVVLPKGLTEIPSGMFERCEALGSVELPETVKTIGAGAFDNCGSLTEIQLPDGLTLIGDAAFFRTGLKQVTIPAKVKRIGTGAFSLSNDLQTLTILNPNCKIMVSEYDSEEDRLIVPATTVLRGYTGSTAEKHAKLYGKKFESIGDSPTPTKLTGLQLTAERGQQIRLTWDAQQCAKGYQVYRSTSKKAGSFRRIAVVRDAAYTDSGLNPGTTYYYVVRAYAKQDGKYVYGAYAMAKQTARG